MAYVYYWINKFNSDLGYDFVLAGVRLVLLDLLLKYERLIVTEKLINKK